MNGQEFLKLVEGRFSARKFTDEALTDEEVGVILEAARLSPSARNSQPTRLCVVRSDEGLAKIDECTKCRYGAPLVIIGAFDSDESAKGLGFESGDFGDIDTTIALTNMEMAAASLGLNSCWVGAYDPQAVRERFGVPERYRLVDMLMVGHGDADPSPRHFERKSLDEIVSWESF